MTFEQAKQMNLDVYTMPQQTRQSFVETMTAAGRNCVEFEETVAGFVLYAVAVGPRESLGQIAREMKRQKAPMQVLRETQEE